MSQSLDAAFAGLSSRAAALDVVANNLSNIGTAGFKKDQVFFSTLDEMRHKESGGDAVFVNSKTAVDFANGELTKTGNPLHLALAADGFFAVQTPKGVRYTRDGSFTLNSERELTTSNGFRVLGEGGKPLVLSGTNIEVSPEGEISVDGVVAGKLQISSFQDPARLKKQGGAMFEAPADAKKTVPTRIQVQQGFIEQANVGATQAMAEMIAVMRSFETLSQAVRSISTNVDQKVIDEVGKT